MPERVITPRGMRSAFEGRVRSDSWVLRTKLSDAGREHRVRNHGNQGSHGNGGLSQV